MAIEFVCTNCGKTLRVPDEHLGKNARCPACQTINLIQPADSAAFDFESKESEFKQPQTDFPNINFERKVNPYAATNYAGAQPYLESHRGGLVLALGIVAITCGCFFVPGILAWVFGSSDLKKMKAGLMDRSGESMTMVGMVLGIISVALPIMMIILYVVIVIFAFVFAR